MTSLMLMALMLYINAIKIFHTHPGGYSFNAVRSHAFTPVSSDNQGQHIVHGNQCAICDFQLTKDADVAAADINMTPVRQVDEYRAVCLNAWLPVFPISTSGRAPPAMA
jgi:hypothetical protein